MSYLPASDYGLLDWSDNFASKLAPAPTAFGLTMEQVGDYQQLQGDYAAAYATAITPATRTKPTIETKNDVKAAKGTSQRCHAASRRTAGPSIA